MHACDVPSARPTRTDRVSTVLDTGRYLPDPAVPRISCHITRIVQSLRKEKYEVCSQIQDGGRLPF